MTPYSILSATPHPILKSHMSLRPGPDALNSGRMDFLEGTGRTGVRTRDKSSSALREFGGMKKRSLT